MKRTLILTAGIVACMLACVSVSEAQVFIRAPFVRVYSGNGVGVRAPFVNLWIPGDGPYYGPPVYGPPIYGPRVIYVPPPVVVPQTQTQPQPYVPPTPQPQPQPQPVPDSKSAPPIPIGATQTPTLDGFSKTFQAKPGSYDVTVINPVNQQPTAVHFTLPAGTPRRVVVTRDSIEWIYALRQWVRIEFDRDGATVTAR